MALGVMTLIEADPMLKHRPELDSSVGARFRALVNRDIEGFSLGELAFCLRQGLAVGHVAPIAIEAVAVSPFVCAEHYAGDLLASLVNSANIGQLSARDAREVRDICTSAIAALEALREEVVPDLIAFVEKYDAA